MKEKIFNLSFMRVTACIAVIILHITASESILYQDVLNRDQQFAMSLIYNLMMWAVPCFVMVSGALLLDPGKQYGLRKVVSLIRRPLFAILVFSILFCMFDTFMGGGTVGLSSVLMGLQNAYTGNGWSHMWYLYLLIGLYLILPAMRLIAAHGDDKTLIYLIVVNILFLSVMPLTKLAGISGGFYLHLSTVYPMYFLLGYLIKERIVRIPPVLSVLMVVVSIAGITVATAKGLDGSLPSPTLLTGYSSAFVIMLSAGIFSLVQHISGGNSAAGRMILQIDQCSFGIYLIQMIFIRLLLRYQGINLYDYPIVLSLPAVTLLVFLASFLISYVFRKLKELTGLA